MIILSLLLFVINIYGFFVFLQTNNVHRHNILTVEFLSVGQGDSVLITAPNQNTVLIDSSPNEIVVRKISKALKYPVKRIDLFLATHADLDHIGGTPSLIKKYKVKDFAFNFDLKISNLTIEINQQLEKNKINKIILKAGDRIILDKLNNVVVDVYWPHSDFINKDKNENSIICVLRYNEINFVLTGDAGKEVEKHLIDLYDRSYLSAEVLKLGHHGSDTSTSAVFLNAVSPDYVIISAGLDNKFGHPHEEVIQRVISYFKNGNNISEIEIDNRIKETKNGPVIFQTDGRDLWSKN